MYYLLRKGLSIPIASNFERVLDDELAEFFELNNAVSVPVELLEQGLEELALDRDL